VQKYFAAKHLPLPFQHYLQLYSSIEEIYANMSSANNVGNAGPHVCQTFLNDVFTFLTEVRSAGRIVNTGTSSVNSEFVTGKTPSFTFSTLPSVVFFY
jgi:hypothetical protein